MRTTILFVTLILLSLALSAIEPQKGERPFIDIYQVPDSAIEAGRIKIKLDARLLSYVQSLPIVEGKLPSFGLPALDDLNNHYKIKEITQLFYSPALSKSFSWRHSEWGFPLWFELRFEPTSSLRDLVMAYRELKDLVQWAEPEYKKRLVTDNSSAIRLDPNDQSRWSSNDPMLGNQWHYNNTGQNSGTPGADIRLFNAWDIEKGNTSVIVAIIDGGIQINHPDLAANIWSGVGYNFVNNSPTIVAHDHGTHVSGTVAAVTNNSVGVAGVAGGNGTQAGVSLMSCQVFTDSDNNGFHLAPIYAADNGAAVSQNSWSYTSVGVYDQNVLDAIDYFNTNGGGTVMNGGITIFAAGNEDSEGLWYPSCYNGAFSVAGTTNQDTKAYYSNYGTWVDVSAPGGETISLSARGVLSTLTGGTYGYYQGTSMACPHVSGIAALALSYTSRNGTTISNNQLANALLAGTDDHYAQNPAYLGKLGTGRMNTASVLSAFTPGMPSCQITAPATGGIYDVGTQIAISVSASDSDGSISRVDFFLNDATTPAYTDSSFPYGWTWNTGGLSTGSYTITAKAFDNEGNQASDQINLALLGIADEGFESGNFSTYGWTHSGSLPWIVQSAQSYSGQYAAKSGTITHNQQSTLSVSLQISSPGNISFFKKVSSESGYDVLMFYIDGDEMGSWSGEVDWAFHSYAVSSGLRTFTWTYTKDVSLSSNSDCAWLDHISFPSHSQYYAPPLAFTATPGNQIVTLSWQSPDSGTPTGYKIFKNGSLLSTVSTTSYLDQAVSNGTTYSYYLKAVYASGESEATPTVNATPQEVVDVILGSGTSTTGTQDGSPVNVYYKSLHGQAIYTAAELNATGVYGPINITALGFFVVSAPIYALPNFVIRLKHCSDTNVLSWQSETGLVTVYSSASFSPQTGSYQMLQFSTPFTWNGVDNLVVDTGFGLLTNYSSSGTIRYTSVSNGYRFIRDDNSNMTSTFTGGSISSYRPNIKFNLESIPTGPEIAVDTQARAFGAVAVGASSSQQISIENPGTQTLSGQITTPLGFSIAESSREQTPGFRTLNSRMSMDFLIAAGQTKLYDLSFVPDAAMEYSGVVSISSNAINNSLLSIQISGTGYIPPTISLSTGELFDTLPPSSQNLQNFVISNLGSQTLNYSISIQESRAGQRPLNSNSGSSSSSRSITGSTLSLDISEYAPGSTMDWTFSLYNASTDDEWLEDVSITFPAGLTINSVSNFVGGTGGAMIPNHSSGNGITITWHGESSGWGVVYSGQTAVATVNLSIPISHTGLISLPFEIVGDGYASTPHSLPGNIEVTQGQLPIQWIAIEPLNGSIEAGQQQSISVLFSSTGVESGDYQALITIVSNDPVNPELQLLAGLTVLDPVIVTSPLLGDAWQSGSQHNVSWEYYGQGTGVNFSFSTNGGTNWSNPSRKACTQGANSFTWTVPYAASTNCLIRLTDEADPNFQATSGVFSIIRPLITVTPTSLSFGDILLQSSSVLSFTLSNPGTATLEGTITTPVAYEVSAADRSPLRSSRETRNSLAYSIPAGESQVFEVTFSPTALQIYLGNIQISHNSGGLDRTVSLSGYGVRPVLQISAVEYEEELVPGQLAGQSITLGNGGGYALSYSLSVPDNISWLSFSGENAVSGTVAAGAPAQNLALEFSALGLAPGTYETAIQAQTNDFDHPSFVIEVSLTILNPLVLLSPQGGENWESGSLQNLSWNYLGVAESVTLSYSPDAGLTWIQIAEYPPEPGVNNYFWQVPLLDTEHCLIRIQDGVAPHVEINSEEFSIHRPALTVPQALSISLDPNGSALLSWQAAAGNPDGYQVYVSSSPVFSDRETILLGFVPAPDTQFTDTQAASRARAFYFVKAVRE